MKTLIVGPNAVTSKVIVDLADLFNSDNCIRVYRTDGNYKSWSPDAELNAISALEQDKGYLIVMKDELDVSEDFMSLDDIGATAPTYSLITKSVTNDLQIKFVDTNGTTVLHSDTVLHSQNGIAGDLTPYLGKKIKFSRSNYNAVWYMTMKTLSGGVSLFASYLTINNPNFIGTIPSDCLELNLVIDNTTSPIAGQVYLKPGNLAQALIYAGQQVASDLVVSVTVQQNDPIGGSTVVATFDVTIPAGDTSATHDFDVSGLANPNYLQVSGLSYSSPDFYTFL